MKLMTPIQLLKRLSGSDGLETGDKIPSSSSSRPSDTIDDQTTPTSRFVQSSYPSNGAAAMALTEDHEYLYISSNASSSQTPGPIMVIDAKSGDLSPLSSFGLKSPPVKAIVASGGRVFTAHRDMKIRVWTRTDKLEHKLEATLPSLQDCLLTYVLPSGTGSSSQHRRHHHHHHLRVSSKRRRSDDSHLATKIQHRDAISALAIGSAGAILYSGSWDRTIKVWSVAANSFKCVESFAAHEDAVNALATTPSGGELLLSASADGEIRAWEPRSDGGKRRHCCLAASAREHSGPVNALLLSNDLVYTASADKSVGVWEQRSRQRSMLQVVEFLRGHSGAVLCLAASRDGEFLASGSADRSVRIWGRSRQQHWCVAALDGHHPAPIKSIAVVSSPARGGEHHIFSSSLDGQTKGHAFNIH